MSWLRALRVAALGVLTLGLTGCFTPLYGPTASGERLDAVMAAIEVDDVETLPVFDRLGVTGCAALVAQEFGEHPDCALGRMRWARRAVRDAFGVA